MDKVNIKVTPSYNFDTSDLGLKTETQFGDMPAQIATKIMNLEDEAVKSTLTALGWIPPNQTMESDFDTWWFREGEIRSVGVSGSTEHNKRLCRVAWENGAYTKRT